MKYFCKLILLIFLACSDFETQETNNFQCFDKSIYLINPIERLVVQSQFDLNRINMIDKNIVTERLFTGDSVAAEWPYEPEGYKWFFNDNSDSLKNINTGLYGQTTCSFLYEYETRVTQFQAKNVFIHLGGVDLILNADEKKVAINLEIIINSIRSSSPDSRIIYGAIPPSIIPTANSKRKLVNDYVHSVIKKTGNACFIYVDDFMSLGGIEGFPRDLTTTTDGVHLNSIAYSEYKNRIEAAILDIDFFGTYCY